MSPTASHAPRPARAASVCLTFDNLGEAAELECGTWNSDCPIGAHYTVRDVLPRLLPLLDEIPCTFFIEAWNVAHYGAALLTVAAQGHEIAIHGWRHENWRSLDAESERQLLVASINAFKELGIRPVGFRPPGGDVLPSTAACLVDLGLRYVSPAGSPDSGRQGLATVPFRWDAVDALYLEPRLDHIRVRQGRPGPVEPLRHWKEAGAHALRRVVDEGGNLTLLFHPYLLGLHPDQFDWLREFVRTLRAAPVNLLTCAQRADQLLADRISH